jgi:hypothetical protein
VTHLSNGTYVQKPAGHDAGVRFITHERQIWTVSSTSKKVSGLHQKRSLICREPTGMMTFDKRPMVLFLELSEANQG